MRSMLKKIGAYFPERSLVIRSGSGTRYAVVKKWHQLTALTFFVCVFAWTGTASVGFSWNYASRVEVEAKLSQTVDSNRIFLAQLESDQKYAYELRQLYNAEVDKNEDWSFRYQTIRKFSSETLQEKAPEDIFAFSRWLKTSLTDEVKKNDVWNSHFQNIRGLTSQVLNEETPDMADTFIPWLMKQLKVRITEVESANSKLNKLVMDMSQSVSEISGHSPPASSKDAGPWLTDVAGDLTVAYKTQSDAMELLHDAMRQALQTGFATIEETALAKPEFAGLSPSFGTGGLSHESSDDEHVFEQFADRSKRLMKLSKDWQQLQTILECAPLTSPVDYYNLTSKYGNRKDPFTKKPAWHQGVDLGAWPGTRVRATAPGEVTYAGRKGGYGQFIVIDHGCGIETAYGHLKRIHVKKGQIVDYRNTIGEVGSTGRSTGPHVYYEIRIKGKPVDPYQFIKAGRYVFKEQKTTVADTK